jgi:uncharacterized metal-binding protein YceD (DUF177 family)
MQDDLPWSHPIEVSALPAEGRSYELVPDEATRKRLAAVANVVSIASLNVSLLVRPVGEDGAEATGSLEGMVRQTCVVSLEEFDNKIAETIAVDFAVAAESKAETEDEEEIEDLPDPIVGGKIDLGALATEFLILAIDPYPRKPGAALEVKDAPEESPEPRRNPFEQLSGLKDRLKKGE